MLFSPTLTRVLRQAYPTGPSIVHAVSSCPCQSPALWPMSTTRRPEAREEFRASEWFQAVMDANQLLPAPNSYYRAAVWRLRLPLSPSTCPFPGWIIGGVWRIFLCQQRPGADGHSCWT